MTSTLKRTITIVDSRVKVASGISFLFGLWLIISPFLLGFSTLSRAAMWDAVIVGISVAILSAIRFFNPMRQCRDSPKRAGTRFGSRALSFRAFASERRLA